MNARTWRGGAATKQKLLQRRDAENAENRRVFPGARLVSSRSRIIGECRLGLLSGLPYAHLLRVGTTRAPFWLRLQSRCIFALKSH